MIKKVLTGAVAAAALAAGATAIVPAAQAREGATSVGHGIKCYYLNGVQYCYKGV